MTKLPMIALMFAVGCSSAVRPDYSFPPPDASVQSETSVKEASVEASAKDAQDESSDSGCNLSCTVYNQCETCAIPCIKEQNETKCNKCIARFTECVIQSLEQATNLDCACRCEQIFYQEVVECFADAGYKNEVCVNDINQNTAYGTCLSQCSCGDQ